MGENTPHPPHTYTSYSPLSRTRFSCLKVLNGIHSQVILVFISVSIFWVPVGSLSVPPFSDLSFCLRLGCFSPPISLPPKAHLHTTRFFAWWYFLSFHHCGHPHNPSCTFVSPSKFLSSPWSQTSSCSTGLLPALSLWCPASSHHLPHLKKETMTPAPFTHRWHPGEAVAAFSSSSLQDRGSQSTEWIKFYISAAAGG